ncbi:MAG: hypothetical protein ACTHKV_00825 [Flavipsychrobacter sp.]
MRKIYIAAIALLLSAGTSVAQTKPKVTTDTGLQDSVLSFLVNKLPTLDGIPVVHEFGRNKSADLFYNQDVAPNYDLSVAIENITKELNLQKMPAPKKWTKAIKRHPLTEQKLQPKAGDMVISIQKPIYRDGMYYVLATAEVKQYPTPCDFLFVYDNNTLTELTYSEEESE